MKRRSMAMWASPEPASSNVRRKRSSLSRSPARSTGCAVVTLPSPARAFFTCRSLVGMDEDSILSLPLRARDFLLRRRQVVKISAELGFKDFSERIAGQRIDEYDMARLLVT